MAPGTCGSAVASGIYLAAVWAGVGPYTAALVMLAVAAWGFAVTILYGDQAIARYGPDPRMIVSDELCGQAITYLGLWHFSGGAKEMVLWAGAGFLLFRFFDIVKPPPARQLERVRGAWGVLLDDVMAGVYANIVMQILYRYSALKLLCT